MYLGASSRWLELAYSWDALVLCYSKVGVAHMFETEMHASVHASHRVIYIYIYMYAHYLVTNSLRYQYMHNRHALIDRQGEVS